MASYCNNRHNNPSYKTLHRNYEREPFNFSPENNCQQHNLQGRKMKRINPPRYLQPLHVTRDTHTCAPSQNDNCQNSHRKYPTKVLYPRTHHNVHVDDENTNYLVSSYNYEYEHECELEYGYNTKMHNTPQYNRHSYQDGSDHSYNNNYQHKEQISNANALHESRNPSMRTRLTSQDTPKSPSSMNTSYPTTETRPNLSETKDLSQGRLKLNASRLHPRHYNHHLNQENNSSGYESTHKVEQDELQNQAVQQSTDELQIASVRDKNDYVENDKKNQDFLSRSVPNSISCRNTNTSNDNDNTLKNDPKASDSISEPALYEYAKLLTEMSAKAHIEANDETKVLLPPDVATKPFSTRSHVEANSLGSCQKNNEPATISPSLSMSTSEHTVPSPNSIHISSSSYKNEEIITRNTDFYFQGEDFPERDKKCNDLKLLPPPPLCYERNHYYHPENPEMKNVIQNHNDQQLTQDQQQLHTFQHVHEGKERHWYRFAFREQKFRKEWRNFSTEAIKTEHQHHTQTDVLAEEYYNYGNRENISVNHPFRRQNSNKNYNSVNSCHDIYLSKSFDEFRSRGNCSCDVKKRSSSYSPRAPEKAFGTSPISSRHQHISHSTNFSDQYRDYQDKTEINLSAHDENYIFNKKRPIRSNYTISPIKREDNHFCATINEHHGQRQYHNNIIRPSQTFPPAAPPPHNPSHHPSNSDRFFPNTCTTIITTPPPAIKLQREQSIPMISPKPTVQCNYCNQCNGNRCNTMFEYDQYSRNYDDNLSSHTEHLQQRNIHYQNPTFPPYQRTHVIKGISREQKEMGTRKKSCSRIHHNEISSRISLPKPRTRILKAILRKKFTWKHYPELESFLIKNREEYLRHSALNYTAQQKKYNNRLTERILELADKEGYIFDEKDFDFVTVRDRVRCYYKSYVQSSKKRGMNTGYRRSQAKSHDNDS